MKFNAIAIAMLCGSALFAAQEVKITTKPDWKTVTGKEINSISIFPANLKKDKFYRLTCMIKPKKADMLVCKLVSGKKPSWHRLGTRPAEWTKFVQYYAPGEAWTTSLDARSKGNTIQVKDVKLEELDEKDLTTNLLPSLKECGWYSAWSDKSPKLDFVKSEDSPFGAEVLSTEINKGTGYPAILAIPAIPGRTVVVSAWVKGDTEAWWVTVERYGTVQTFAVKNGWSKQEVRIKLAGKAPGIASLLFWKPRNQKSVKCTFGKVEVYYAK